MELILTPMSVFHFDAWFLLIALSSFFFIWVHFLILLQAVLVKTSNNKASMPLSVVVVARNEKENLETLLPAILNQHYANFELIVVDDHSWDGTHELMHEWLLKDERLQLITLDENVQVKPGKKLSLTLAIKKAKHEHIIFTDADCIPRSEYWLQEMANVYNHETEVVLGVSPYLNKSGLLNGIIRFESFLTAWHYISLAQLGAPYMGVGRNLSYKKSTFLKVKGFSKHLSIPFGDDDLFVQTVANKHNTKVAIHAEAQVNSYPKTTVKTWIKQKKRHLSASFYYKPQFKFTLFMLWFFRASFYASVALYFVFALYSIIALIIIVVAIMSLVITGLLFNKKTKMIKGATFILIYDCLYQLLVHPFLSIKNFLKPTGKQW